MNFIVNLDVDDLDKATGFYSHAFGLSVGRRFGDYGVEMLGGPAPIYLLVRSTGTTASPTTSQRRSYERHWTPVHLDFVVDEIEPVIERAVSAGARLEKPLAAHKWGQLALMVDPFGHGFCFVQFLGRGYDELAFDADHGYSQILGDPMKYKGSCHCGKITLEVEGDLAGAMACNCSMCRRKGSLLWFVPRGQLRLLTAEDDIGTYTFNKHVVKHRFCPACGIHPFGEGVDPKGNLIAAINIRCLEGIDLEAVPVQHFDGRSM